MPEKSRPPSARQGPVLLEIPSPFEDGYGIVRLLEPPGTPLQPLWEQLQSGRYNRPFILEDGQLRTLHFSLRFVQSAMRIDDPDHLELVYSRYMMSFLLWLPDPARILLAGLGGGSMVRFLHRHLPTADLTVLENHPDVIALRQEFAVPPDDQRFRVVEADALTWLCGCPPVDVLLLDIFDRHGLVGGLCSIPFFEDARRALGDGGLMLINLAGPPQVWQPVEEMVRAVFGQEVWVLPVDAGLNRVLLARPATRRPLPWRAARERAAHLATRTGLDFPAMLGDWERQRRRGPSPGDA